MTITKQNKSRSESTHSQNKQPKWNKGVGFGPLVSNSVMPAINFSITVKQQRERNL